LCSSVIVLDSFFALPDVFETGVWPELRNIKDPELKDLAESLPLLVLHSKAPSTMSEEVQWGF